ncbi:type II secretion system ATPase GspE [Natronospora cellulosivora (SeqCode)]
MAAQHYKKLGELLVDFNFISPAQLEDAIKHQKESDKRLGEILIELNYVSADDLIQVLEFQLGVPHVKLSNYIFDPQLAHFIPEHLAKRHNVIALEKKGNRLLVAMSDPSNLLAIDDLEMTSGLKIEPRIAILEEIKTAINQVYSIGEEDTTDIIASLDDYQSSDEPELDKLKEMVEDAPIVKLTNRIITQALQARASDIHIEPQENGVRIRYRIDGVLREIMKTPKYSQAALISRLKIIADLDITKRRIPQDGRIAITVNEIKVDLRVSTLPTVFGEKVVIRLLTKDSNLINIEKLGFNDNNVQRFKGLIEQPHGILLVTGPTGSGKSTTLFAALNNLNSPEKNIVTVEDPVEYQIGGVNQIQANKKTGLTFASALRSILRQDPDIVMVGEIRDEETARIAVRASLTGHLVLSTLHTNDAASSITRLIDMGIEPYMAASTIIGVVAQRLIRRLCKSCKVSYEPSADELTLLKGDPEGKFYKAKGCPKCNNTGYKGRIAVHEVLIVDEKLKEYISKDAGEQTLKNYSKEHGMTTLMEDGIAKFRQGITSYEEIIRVLI